MVYNTNDYITIPHHEVPIKLKTYIGCITKIRIKFPEHANTTGLSNCVSLTSNPQFQDIGKHIIEYFTSKYIDGHLSCIGHISRSRLFLSWLEKRLENWSITLNTENVRLIFRDYIAYLKTELRDSSTVLGQKQSTLLQSTAKMFFENYLDLDSRFLEDGTALLRTKQAATNSYIPPLVEEAEIAFKFYLKKFNEWLATPENNTAYIPNTLPYFIHYFFYLLQAITGMNVSQVQRLRISMIEEASNLSNKHRDPRIKVVKARASYIEQEFEYPLWFDAEIVSKYRGVVNRYPGRVIYIGDIDKPSQERDYSYKRYNTMSRANSEENDIPYILTSEWRKFKGHFVSKRFGHAVSAMLSQHSEETAHRHYRTINEVEAQAEMGNFFRFQEDLHNLIEKGSMGKAKQSIPAGGCDAESPEDRPDHLNPKQQSFYIGDCKTPAGCLFCKHYVVHADEEDFWKLESLRFYISELALRQTNLEHVEEIHGSILNRVEDILSTLGAKPDAEKMWREAKEKVARKNLYPIWKRLLTTQIKLGRLDS